jgi:hypothetical protein
MSVSVDAVLADPLNTQKTRPPQPMTGAAEAG